MKRLKCLTAVLDVLFSAHTVFAQGSVPSEPKLVFPKGVKKIIVKPHVD